MTTLPDGEDVVNLPAPDPYFEALEVYLGVLEYIQQQIGQATMIHLRGGYTPEPVAATVHVVDQIEESREDE